MLDQLTPQEFDAFVSFGRARLADDAPVASLEELADEWRSRQEPEVSVADKAAVAEAVADYRNGDRGRLALDHLGELQARLGNQAR